MPGDYNIDKGSSFKKKSKSKSKPKSKASGKPSSQDFESGQYYIDTQAANLLGNIQQANFDTRGEGPGIPEANVISTAKDQLAQSNVYSPTVDDIPQDPKLIASVQETGMANGIPAIIVDGRVKYDVQKIGAAMGMTPEQIEKIVSAQGTPQLSRTPEEALAGLESGESLGSQSTAANQSNAFKGVELRNEFGDEGVILNNLASLDPSVHLDLTDEVTLINLADPFRIQNAGGAIKGQETALRHTNEAGWADVVGGQILPSVVGAFTSFISPAAGAAMATMIQGGQAGTLGLNTETLKNLAINEGAALLTSELKGLKAEVSDGGLTGESIATGLDTGFDNFLSSPILDKFAGSAAKTALEIGGPLANDTSAPTAFLPSAMDVDMWTGISEQDITDLGYEITPSDLSTNIGADLAGLGGFGEGMSSEELIDFGADVGNEVAEMSVNNIPLGLGDQTNLPSATDSDMWTDITEEDITDLGYEVVPDGLTTPESEFGISDVIKGGGLLAGAVGAGLNASTGGGGGGGGGNSNTAAVNTTNQNNNNQTTQPTTTKPDKLPDYISRLLRKYGKDRYGYWKLFGTDFKGLSNPFTYKPEIK